MSDGTYIDPLTGLRIPISGVLTHLASQESCDGEPYDVMLAAASEIVRLQELQKERIEEIETELVEADTAWGVLIALAEKLGIDPEEARKKPGKPSDVYFERLAELEADQRRLREAVKVALWAYENGSVEDEDNAMQELEAAAQQGGE